ncbi:MAG: transglycosylase SLT domain-containing protein [Thermoanaerobaculia bacterium]|nr:transglycosylase SLT domain-containing protein [Thermoanaerobaculia bacterium]
MKRFSSVVPVSLLLILVLVLLAACGESSEAEDAEIPPPVTKDLDQILEHGTLHALVTFNSTGYFIYRGEPLGYEYELLDQFAEDHDLDLSVTVVRDRSELWPRLNRGDGDVAAARVLRTTADEKHVAFTESLYRTRPSLVQRDEPVSAVDIPRDVGDLLDIPKRIDPVNLPARRIEEPEDLSEASVHLANRSQWKERLLELEEEITGDIEVVEVEDVTSVEPLIRRVARGEIRLTVSPKNVAELNEEYFENLMITPTIGPPAQVVWAVRQNAPVLLEKLNAWIEDPENQDMFDELYERYFEDREAYRELVSDEYLSSETGRISEWDDLFREHSKDLGWDWRLLASQAFQESRFDPKARSWAGAMGLLQLMPRTAKEVGVSNPNDPTENVEGAVRYLLKLEEAWKDEILDEEERLKFVFASYNAGRGHVLDAQRLAEKNGDDPDSWEDVAYWLLKLSKREHYTDPVVKYGFVRGLEPVTYVDLILERFEHYQQFVTEG